MPRKAPAAEAERPVATQVAPNAEGQVEDEAEAPLESGAAAGLDVEPVEVELVVVEFDEAACRLRAFEISLSDEAGSPEENWLRAERELLGSPASAAEE